MAAYKGHHYPGPGNHFCKWLTFFYYFTFKLDVLVNNLGLSVFFFFNQNVFLKRNWLSKYTYVFSMCVYTKMKGVKSSDT